MANDDDHKEDDGPSSGSISALAKSAFDKEDQKIWNVTAPVVIKNLSLRKDTHSTFGGSNTSADNAIQTAPNFATAILGRWLADKLKLSEPAPAYHERSDDENNDYVFENLNALVLPGEATLVLGPSSSGKTTLLQTICDLATTKLPKQKRKYIEGTLLLGSTDPYESAENLTRTAAFVDQSDLTLTPILTVEETVRFANSCADATYDKEAVDEYFRLVGLDHVRSTVVGDADIRGVSGGQKRRVKLLEMAVGNKVRLLALDEITNGLDAATALEICKVVQVAVEVAGATALVTLLQPSSEVLSTFARLILLTQDGKVAYSGKTSEAIPHFESLGLVKPTEMNEAEFLLRCATSPTDFWEAGEDIPMNVSSSAKIVKTFEDSQAAQRNLQEISSVQEAEVLKMSSGKAKQNENMASFARPIHEQIALLCGRGYKLVVRNPSSMQRVLFSIIFGAFIATLFLNTASDAAGTSVRAGYVLTLLFLVFINSTSAPLDDLFKDRLTFYTHRRASFYRTCSYYIAQSICSAIVPLLEAFFLSIISFYGVGMNARGGAAFAYFWAMFSLVSLCGASISRVLSYGLPSTDIAQSLAPAVLLLFVLSAGYSPQYQQLPSWLQWLAWISPCAYTYEGVIVSEVWGRNVGDVNGDVWAQENLGIPRIPYKDAPSSLDSNAKVMLFDAMMLIVLSVVFDVLACCLLHNSQKWFGPTTKRFQVASGMSLSAPPWPKSDPSGSETTSVEEGQPSSDEDTSIPKAPAVHLTAKDIVYEVDIAVDPKETQPDSEAKPQASASEDRGDKSTGVIDGETESLMFEERRDVLITAREYGQAGKGTAKEWAIKRRLGEDALNTPSSSASFRRSSSRLELPPPAPGRLRLLSGVTASFEPGTMTALMGESGAGKSTLLDVLAGYKTGGHIDGEIKINGKPKTDETWKSISGYCEQVDLHNPAMTVRESVIFATRLRLRPFSIPDDARISFAEQIISLLELGEEADMLVGDEASGEGLPKHARKRLTVGVELAAKPSIVFADEPTSGLDGLSAAVVVGCLERAAKQQGLTVLCTIHQPSQEVFKAFDNLLLLRKGGECVYNGKIEYLDSYMQAAPNGENFVRPAGANPADHVLSVFSRQPGDEKDWGELYRDSDMAFLAKTSFTSCSCESCNSVETAIDAAPMSFWSELWIVTQRQALSHWRTPTYMAVRFWWTLVANVLVGIVYFQTSVIFDIIGAIFFYVNIATVPLTSAIVPLLSERAVYYREVASGTYRRSTYGMAVQLAEVIFNVVSALVSFVVFYFMVGLKNDGDRIIYFFLMALATYWMLPTFGQLFGMLSPNVGAAVGTGALVLTLFTLTMGFLLPPNKIPDWYIWIYWTNPLRYLQQGFVVNEVGGDPLGDEILSQFSWSFTDRWWYCYVAVLLFGVVAGVGVVWSTKISWLKR